jgi:hypothetical protein
MAQPKDPVFQIGLSREAWGPRFWKILHTLAESSGHQTHLITSNDEADMWILLLKSQANAMPCELCKKHYIEWYLKNRPDHLHEIRGEERRNWIRGWLYGCHNRVNEMNGKESPPFENLPLLYPIISLKKEYQEILGMFQLAHNKRQLKPEETIKWRNAVMRLRAMAGI